MDNQKNADMFHIESFLVLLTRKMQQKYNATQCNMAVARPAVQNFSPLHCLVRGMDFTGRHVFRTVFSLSGRRFADFPGIPQQHDLATQPMRTPLSLAPRIVFPPLFRRITC